MADSAVHGHRRTKHHRLEVLDLGGNAGDRERPVLAHAFRRLLLWLSNPLYHFMSREVFLIRSIHLAATDYPTRKHSDEATACNGSQIRTGARLLQRHVDYRGTGAKEARALQRQCCDHADQIVTREHSLVLFFANSRMRIARQVSSRSLVFRIKEVTERWN